MRTNRTITLFGALALTTVLGACGSEGSDEASTSQSSSSPTTSEAASTVEEPASLTVTDPWVKSAESGMTAAFGTLVNAGDADVTIVSAEADITDAMELHETVENDDGGMAMQPKEGGFVVPAGGEHELAPGGDHLMMMDLLRPVEPGEIVTITLTFDDGSTTAFEATVKAFTGADEEYQNGDMHMGSDDGSSEGN
jgi:copper(I)-binding protein